LNNSEDTYHPGGKIKNHPQARVFCCELLLVPKQPRLGQILAFCQTFKSPSKIEVEILSKQRIL